jgi:hypothetical protein
MICIHRIPGDSNMRTATGATIEKEQQHGSHGDRWWGELYCR